LQDFLQALIGFIIHARQTSRFANVSFAKTKDQAKSTYFRIGFVCYSHAPIDTHMSRTTTWGKGKTGSLYAMPIIKNHHGHSGSKRLKVVCRTCNNGWMSRMENRTRPILMRLIQGIPHRLSSFDQAILAAWTAKTIMVAEFGYPHAIAIPDVERLRMYAATEVQENWAIWIADYKGTDMAQLVDGTSCLRISPEFFRQAVRPKHGSSA
jgi:hypothetical protein